MIGVMLRNRYEVLEMVDEGPIFFIYRAKDRMSGRDFIVRLLKSPFDRETAFHEELQEIVKDLSVISSPLVERLVDVDNYEGITYILSEAKSGQKLSERIKKLAPYTVPVAVSMTLQILEAIHSVNSQGFAHGEITSDHILVNSDGKLFLLQPGLWVAYGASITAGKAILPSLAPYLAPEVFEGRMMPSPTSDVYGAGIVLYELLSGRHPYNSDSPAGYLQKHLTSPIPGIRQINPSVPTVVEEFIKKALAKHPQNRYTNARSMMSDLRMIQDALRFGRNLEWPIKGSEANLPAPVMAPKGALPPNYFETAPEPPVEAAMPTTTPLQEFAPTISEHEPVPLEEAVINHQLIDQAVLLASVPISSQLQTPQIEPNNEKVEAHGPEAFLGSSSVQNQNLADTSEEFKWPSASTNQATEEPEESQSKPAAKLLSNNPQISQVKQKGQDIKQTGNGNNWRPNPEDGKSPPTPPSKPARNAKDFDQNADRMPKWASALMFCAICILVLVISGGLFWFNTKPKTIQVPNLVGSSVSEAQQKLSSLGIVLQVNRKEYSETRPEGTILELSPRPGSEVREKGFVRAVVSSGSKFVSVPDLRGLSIEEATTQLSNLELEISQPFNEVRSTRLKPGQIVNQIPSKTSKVERGTKIRVDVATNRRRSTATGREVEAEYELTIRIPQENDPVKVRVDLVDATGTQTVYDDTQHQPGDEFFVTAKGTGDEVYFKVFYDGILVLQKSVRPEEAVNR